jgi:3-ketosteroid 9alpha-monooxygenase subunit B
VAEDSYVLRVAEVVRETDDAVSVVLEVPEELAEVFAHRPGQFLTLAVPSERTGLVARCYSICTAPGEPLTVTVKRTTDGYASRWLTEELRPGDRVRVLPPSGIFTPASLDEDLLLFAAGSGITPVMSIIRTVLAQGSGRLVLLYANRDERSVIFGRALAALAAAYPERLQVVHWLESVQGLPGREQLRAFAADRASWTAFVCGPDPFMKPVVAALRDLGFPRSRRHQEKFVSLGGNPFGEVDEVAAPRSPQSSRL